MLKEYQKCSVFQILGIDGDQSTSTDINREIQILDHSSIWMLKIEPAAPGHFLSGSIGPQTIPGYI